MRNMSFALTTPQFIARTKTVTRRMGWGFLKPGDLVCGVKKAMGLKKGEKLERLGVIRIVSNRRVFLDEISVGDVEREGFPQFGIKDFIDMFCRHMKVTPETCVNRIEFEYMSPEELEAAGQMRLGL